MSDEIGDDLVAQAAAVEADIVLVPATEAELVERLRPPAPWILAVVVAPDVTSIATVESGPVVAVIGEGPNATAALELAARVAFSRQCSLHLIPENGSRAVHRPGSGARPCGN